MSSQLGSIIALWSAKGMYVRTSLSQSLSNAPQPPSRFCMASIQACPRATAPWRARSSDSPGKRTRERAVSTSAVSSVSGYHSLAYSKYQPPGSAAGQAFFQSPTSLTSRSSSQRPALSRIGSSGARPASDRASMTRAVSQIGEKQGCTCSVSSSSSSSFSSSADLRDQAGVVHRVAEAAEGDDRVDDGREDRAEAVGLGQALVDPLLAGGERLGAQGREVGGFGPLEPAVDPA